MAKWPFGNEDNPFDEWADDDTVMNVVNGNARVGFQAQHVTGGMNMDVSRGQVVSTVGGEIRNDGHAQRCTECGGTRGWLIQDGVTTHTGCGAVQS